MIYKLVSPQILDRVVVENYETTTKEGIVLEETEFRPFESVEDAVAEIRKQRNRLISSDLCIIPVVRIDWEGEEK